MKTFKFDLFNDIHLDSNFDIAMAENVEEKTQSVKNLLACRLGEWFLNTAHGLDYFAFLGEKWDDVQEITRAVFLACLEQEPRITQVRQLDFEFDPLERKLRVDFNVVMDGEPVTDILEVGA